MKWLAGELGLTPAEVRELSPVEFDQMEIVANAVHELIEERNEALRG